MSANNSVKWVRLGDYIERSMLNNADLRYGADLIEGVNSNGEFCESKANTIDINLKPYKIVNNGDFVYNPSRLNIGSLAYRTTGMCIVSHLYVVFRLTDYGKQYIIPEFLYLYFKRDEFLRLISFLNIGSQRPEFNFYDMSDIKIPLPSIEMQRDLVNTYNGLKALAEQNEALVEPLNKACEAFIVNCKKQYPLVKLGEYIEESTVKNSNFEYKKVLGLSTKKEFREPNSRVNKNELATYKIVYKNYFAYVPTTDTWKVFACALNKKETIVVSPIYCVFKVIRDNLLPEYLEIIFKPSEFDRYVRFNSWGSARENFSFSELQDVQIPLPPIDVQQSIVNLYNCMEEAKRIASEAREQLKTLCPALVQKAANL